MTPVASRASALLLLAIAAVLGALPPVARAQSAGLVAAYSFNEGTGGTLTDVSGNGNTGTVVGATWTTQGKFGGALTFDGVNDVVLVNDSPSLDLGTAMTLEAWVYPVVSPSGWRAVIQKQVDAYFLHAGSSSVNRFAGGGTVNATIPVAYGDARLNANTWYHLAVTYDGAVFRLYRNGVQVGTAPAAGSLQVTAGALRIGGNTYSTEFFTGESTRSGSTTAP
jgi:Concanavalin A-like lectin/glucanases superfamily